MMGKDFDEKMKRDERITMWSSVILGFIAVGLLVYFLKAIYEMTELMESIKINAGA